MNNSVRFVAIPLLHILLPNSQEAAFSLGLNYVQPKGQGLLPGQRILIH